MNKASKLKKISAICAAFMFALLSIFAALVTQNRTAYKMEVPFEAKAEEGNYKENYFSVENTSVTWNGLTFIWENGIGSVSGTLTKDVNEPYSFNLTSTIPTFRYLYYRAYVDFSGTIITGLGLSTVRAGGLVADGYICSFPKFEVNELYQIMKIDSVARSCFFWIKGNAGDTVNLSLIYPYISDNSLDNSHLPKTIQKMISEKYNAGYQSGYEEGYTTGKNENTQSYYDKGYSDGWAASGSGTFTSLFTAVIDAPVAAFTNLLDFQILGVDMKKFVLALISLALVLAIVRFVLGKS